MNSWDKVGVIQAANMKIAYVVPYVSNFIRTRPYNLISQLMALGHEVTVFTLGTGVQDQKDVERLFQGDQSGLSRTVNVVFTVE